MALALVLIGIGFGGGIGTMAMKMTSAAEVKQLEAKIKADVKQVNDLPKIAKALKHNDKSVSQAAMQSMRRLLVFFAEKGDLKAVTSSSAKKAKTEDAMSKFRNWLWDIYVAFIKEMLEWLHHGRDENVQINALRTLMEFVSRDGELRGSAPAFGNETFMQVVQQLVANPKLKGELTSVFSGEYVRAYQDVQYYMLRNLTQILEAKMDGKPEDAQSVTTDDTTFVSNALLLLNTVDMPASVDDISSFLVEVPSTENGDEDEGDDDDDESDKEGGDTAVGSKRKADDEAASKKANKGGVRSLKQHRHVYSMCWIAMLRHRLPQAAYKKILMQLPFEIMPHLENPLLLSDFLTDSYNIGGVTSLLALNGLFLLITDHNFDYPDFYNKLYQLLEDPSLLTAKQRFRFFGLLELFLSSSHLPAYMIAAFAKRLARVSLVAEPGAIIFIIPMVYNLILRHKECIQLIHRTGAITASEAAKKRREELSSTNSVDAAAMRLVRANVEIALQDGHDPYRSDEKDPQKCNALQSSLWEIHTMRHHCNAEVALKAKMFEEKLRSQFLDLDDDMDVTYKSMFDQQLKRRVKGKVALAFKPCTALFDEEDTFASVFEL